MSGEVTQKEFGEGLVVVEDSLVRRPFGQEYERLLGAMGRTPAQHAGLAQVEDEMVAALARGADAVTLPELHQLRATQ